MYEFQEKLEKLKKTKLWVTTENKKNKQVRFCRFSLFLVVVFSTAWKFIFGIIHLVRSQYFARDFLKFKISYFLIRTRTCAYQGVKDLSFKTNFAFELNKWSLAYRKTNFSNTAEAHSEPSHTSKIEPFLEMVSGF